MEGAVVIYRRSPPSAETDARFITSDPRGRPFFIELKEQRRRPASIDGVEAIGQREVQAVMCLWCLDAEQGDAEQ